jgi:alpha-ketoglutarate-dependent taurine dioxygenase
MSMLRIEPTDATLGAVVTGVSLADLDAPTWSTLHEAWLEHALLIFPGQHLSNAQQIAFAQRLGPIERIGGGAIVAISNVRDDGTVRAHEPAEWDAMMKIIVGNMAWHADSTYMPVMAKGAVFSGEVVPPAGGETGFADMRAAYDALDNATRALVHQRSAHHSLVYSQSKLGHVHSEDPPRDRPPVAADRPPRTRDPRHGRGRVGTLPRRSGRLGLPAAPDLPPPVGSR